MSAPSSRGSNRRPWAAYTAVAITAAACVAALLFRGPLLARYWAFRLVHADTPAGRQAYVSTLCQLGPSARWAIPALLSSSNPEDRRDAVLLLSLAPAAWARTRALEALRDPDDEVRHAAAIYLALHGQDDAVPALKWYYQCADTSAAASACVALEYLGTPEAIRTLTELAGEDADVDRRAALVDALAGIGAAACVPGLLRVLDDHRLCDRPPRSELAARRLWERIRTAPHVPPLATLATSAPAARTIAERAAAALGRITGLELPFSSRAPETERREYRQRWEDWWRRQSENE